MSKHVLMLLSNGFDPDPRVLSEALALIANGYSVTLICWNRDRGLRKPSRENIQGLRVQRVGPQSRHNLGVFQALFVPLFWLSILARGLFLKFDLVHCHDFDTLPPGFLLAKIKRSKLVYDSHENFSKMIQYDVSPVLAKAIDYIERIIVGHVDLTLTVGEILAEEFIEKGANNVRVVGNWKDPDGFIYGCEELMSLKKSLHIIDDQRKLIITYITTLKDERKISEIIEAVQGQEHFVLILAGKGPMEETIKEKIRGKNNIRFLGFVSPVDVPKYTAISDVVFYGFEPANENSKYSAPNKLFEALAAGKVLISCDIGEIGRIIHKYACGLIIENYKPLTIRNALDYYYQRSDKLIEGKRKASILGKTRYNWNEAKKTLYESYEALFKST